MTHTLDDDKQSAAKGTRDSENPKEGRKEGRIIRSSERLLLRGIMKTRRINSIIPTGFQLSKTRILYPATLGKLRSPGNERRNSRNVWARLKTLREPSGWYREGKVIEEDSRQLQLQNPHFLDPDLSYLGRCIFASIDSSLIHVCKRVWRNFN